ncbi:MAG: hypothetical protein KUG82_18685 [Pseudomonadales bacterium]|nr:hypothetical protein [Pseudomonadales bacterium]
MKSDTLFISQLVLFMVLSLAGNVSESNAVESRTSETEVSEEVGNTAAISTILSDLPGILDQIRERNEYLVKELAKDGGAHDSREMTEKVQSRLSRQRDPFSVTPKISEYATVGSRASARFTPLGEGGFTTPTLILRGIINRPGEDEPLALLDVQGSGVFMVRAGDTISLHNSGASTVLKINEIGRLSLMVEVGTLGETIVVR